MAMPLIAKNQTDTQQAYHTESKHLTTPRAVYKARFGHVLPQVVYLL